MPLSDVIIVQTLYIYTGIDSICTSQGYDWVHNWMWVYNINFIHKLWGSFVPVESGLWDHSRAPHVKSKHIYLVSTKTLCPTEAWVQQRRRRAAESRRGLQTSCPAGQREGKHNRVTTFHPVVNGAYNGNKTSGSHLRRACSARQAFQVCLPQGYPSHFCWIF